MLVFGAEFSVTNETIRERIQRLESNSSRFSGLPYHQKVSFARTQLKEELKLLEAIRAYNFKMGVCMKKIQEIVQLEIHPIF